MLNNLQHIFLAEFQKILAKFNTAVPRKILNFFVNSQQIFRL